MEARCGLCMHLHGVGAPVHDRVQTFGILHVSDTQAYRDISCRSAAESVAAFGVVAEAVRKEACE